MPVNFNTYYHFKSRLKNLPGDVAWHLGGGKRELNKGGEGRILVYHGICRKDPLRYSTIFLTLRSLEKQLLLYKKYFNIISLDDFYQQRFSKDRFSLCLSFDDGFANNYKYVMPLLEQYEVPAVFFITGIADAGYNILWNDFIRMVTHYGPGMISFEGQEFVKGRNGYISTAGSVRLVDILRAGTFDRKAAMMETLSCQVPFRDKVNSDFWLQMTAMQIRELADSKWVTIGSHGYYHNDLAKISLQNAKDEMIRSKQWLEKTTGKVINAIAFPYGSYTKELVATAKDTGYTQLLGTRFHFEEDRLDNTMRERLTINPFISAITQMHANTRGKYD